MQGQTINVANADATQRLARHWASRLLQRQPTGSLVALLGPLGVGKTFFVREAARALSGNPELVVNSPTFGLARQLCAEPLVWHADLYRLGGDSDATELGLDEALDAGGIVFVEWLDRSPAWLALADLSLAFAFAAPPTAHAGEAAAATTRAAVALATAGGAVGGAVDDAADAVGDTADAARIVTVHCAW